MFGNRKAQRGEGKIGCIISLLVFLVLAGIGFKIVPYWWAVDQLVSSADELASRAGMLPKETLGAQLKAKALELELHEAMKTGAIIVSIQGEGQTGSCSITLRFSRDIDMYGITKVTWTTDKRIVKPWGRF